jgi:predicted dienelactone hydrolase
VSETPTTPTPRPAAPADWSLPATHRLRNSVLAVLAVALIGLLALASYLWVAPAGMAAVSPDSLAATSYADAMARFDEIARSQPSDPSLLTDCRSRLADHGGPTDTVIVLFHGYTNCPAQYHELADELAKLGYTVYVPLMPHHGEADREHSTLDKLTAEQLVAYGNDAVDLADGLGDRVVVMGVMSKAPVSVLSRWSF